MSDLKNNPELELLSEVISDLARPDFGKWSEWKVTDFQSYANEHYQGMLRTQVSKSGSNGNRFFQAVNRRGWADDVFPKSHYQDRRGWGLAEFQKHYDDNFEGMSLNDVRNCSEKNGNGFVQALRKKKYFRQIFPKQIHHQWKDFKEQDFIDYCQKHYQGLSRTEVSTNEDKLARSFYRKVRKSDLLDKVFPDRKKIDWSSFTEETFIEHYNTHYEGMSRGKVAQDRKNGGGAFYQAVSIAGFIESVFPKREHNDWSEWTLEDFVTHLNENYAEMTRSQIQDDIEGGGNAFYIAVTARGLKDEVLPKSKSKSNRWRGFGEKEFAAFYQDNFPGLTRKQVQKDAGKLGTSFYNAVYLRGLVDKILPAQIRKGWGMYSVQELKCHYHDNFPGMSRAQIANDRENGGGGFYNAVISRGLADKVFPKSKGAKKWTEEKIMQVARNIYKTQGKIPTQSFLKKQGHGGFGSAVQKTGGLTKLRLRLELERENSSEKNLLMDLVETLGS